MKQPEQKNYRQARTFKSVSCHLLGAVALTALTAIPSYAQSPAAPAQPPAQPTMIGEAAASTSSQTGIASGLQFLIYSPQQFASTSGTTSKAPANYGVAENFNLLAPGATGGNGLWLNGAALFPSMTSTGAQQVRKQAIDQTIAYRTSALNISVEYSSIGALFSTDGAGKSLLSPDISNSLVGKKGQDGFNTGLDYNHDGTKFGIKYASVADMLQSQHRLSESVSMERDFDRALAISFQRTENSSVQFAGSGASHQTTNILHLAYSPTHSGFLLDATNTNTLSGQGSQVNDVLLKVSQNFARIDLSSQFETSSSKSAPTAGWFSEMYRVSDNFGSGLNVNGTMTKKTDAGGAESDDLDVIMKSTEDRYLQLAAEYAKSDSSGGCGAGNQSLVAKGTPGSAGALGPLLLSLSINNQQTAFLSGLQNYSTTLSGQVASNSGFDFGLTGAKYYLAYTESSAPASAALGTSHRTLHGVHTLRLVSAPAGKDGLSWAVSQQQRLDQNGQPIRTASDYEAKYAFSRSLSVAMNNTFETARPDGSFSDQDQRGITLDWNQGPSCAMIAQYVHTRCASANIAGEDGYFLTYSGPAFSAQKMDIGLGEQTKSDFDGQPAYGTTANVGYAWQADDQNTVNITSKVTDWRNCGFDNTDDTSVEATGQINFQRMF